jgi:hypothetical protein
VDIDPAADPTLRIVVAQDHDRNISCLDYLKDSAFDASLAARPVVVLGRDQMGSSPSRSVK